ncbi:hypothetical protein ES703_71611 [subsurface metagenome]
MPGSKKCLCPQHYTPMDPLYYRDGSASMKRLEGHFVCSHSKAGAHIVQIRSFPVKPKISTVLGS